MRFFVDFKQLGQYLGNRLQVELGVEFEPAVVRQFPLSDGHDEEPEHLLAQNDNFHGASVSHFEPRNILYHFSHAVPQEVEDMQKLDLIFAWGEGEG
jgi:hypothetical protein